MTDAELLTKIKDGLGITGTFQDDTLQVYIDDIKAFLRSAGIPDAVITSNVSVGCIMRGVADLWNYGAGTAQLSDYFKMRMLQLKALRILTVTQGTGTTVTVMRNGTAITGGTVLHLGEIITISCTGGTITVNGESFTSGDSYTVTDNVNIVSVAN